MSSQIFTKVVANQTVNKTDYLSRGSFLTAAEGLGRSLFTNDAANLKRKNATFYLRGEENSKHALELIVTTADAKLFESLGSTPEERLQQIVLATRQAMGKVLTGLNAENARWVGAFHQNTNQRHLHILVSKAYTDDEGVTQSLKRVPKEFLIRDAEGYSQLDRQFSKALREHFILKPQNIPTVINEESLIPTLNDKYNDEAVVDLMSHAPFSLDVLKQANDNGTIVADETATPIFIRRNIEGVATGANWQDRDTKIWKRTGFQNGGWFFIGDLKTAESIILVSTPEEAIALQTLHSDKNLEKVVIVALEPRKNDTELGNILIQRQRALALQDKQLNLVWATNSSEKGNQHNFGLTELKQTTSLIAKNENLREIEFKPYSRNTSWVKQLKLVTDVNEIINIINPNQPIPSILIPQDIPFVAVLPPKPKVIVEKVVTEEKLEQKPKAPEQIINENSLSQEERNKLTYKELTERAKLVSLEAIAASHGLQETLYKGERVWQDSSNTKSIKITNNLFSDRKNGMQGGRGSIDFVAYLQDLSPTSAFKEAREWLINNQGLIYEQNAIIARKPKANEKNDLLMPPDISENLETVRYYLEEERNISFETINKMIEHKLIFANDFSSAVFVHRDIDGHINGASWRDTTKGSTLRGNAIGTDKENGYFYLGDLKNAERFILTEAPIDTLSYYELEISNGVDLSNTAIISLSGSYATQNLLEHLSKRQIQIESENKTLEIVFANDNDNPGEKAFARFLEKFEEIAPDLFVNETEDEEFEKVSIIRQVPPSGKDWNDFLKLQSLEPDYPSIDELNEIQKEFANDLTENDENKEVIVLTDDLNYENLSSNIENTNLSVEQKLEELFNEQPIESNENGNLTERVEGNGEGLYGGIVTENLQESENRGITGDPLSELSGNGGSDLSEEDRERQFASGSTGRSEFSDQTDTRAGAMGNGSTELPNERKASELAQNTLENETIYRFKLRKTSDEFLQYKTGQDKAGNWSATATGLVGTKDQTQKKIHYIDLAANVTGKNQLESIKQAVTEINSQISALDNKGNEYSPIYRDIYKFHDDFLETFTPKVEIPIEILPSDIKKVSIYQEGYKVVFNDNQFTRVFTYRQKDNSILNNETINGFATVWRGECEKRADLINSQAEYNNINEEIELFSKDESILKAKIVFDEVDNLWRGNYYGQVISGAHQFKVSEKPITILHTGFETREDLLTNLSLKITDKLEQRVNIIAKTEATKMFQTAISHLESLQRENLGIILEEEQIYEQETIDQNENETIPGESRSETRKGFSFYRDENGEINVRDESQGQISKRLTTLDLAAFGQVSNEDFLTPIQNFAGNGQTESKVWFADPSQLNQPLISLTDIPINENRIVVITKTEKSFELNKDYELPILRRINLAATHEAETRAFDLQTNAITDIQKIKGEIFYSSILKETSERLFNNYFGLLEEAEQMNVLADVERQFKDYGFDSIRNTTKQAGREINYLRAFEGRWKTVGEIWQTSKTQAKETQNLSPDEINYFKLEYGQTDDIGSYNLSQIFRYDGNLANRAEIISDVQSWTVYVAGTDQQIENLKKSAIEELNTELKFEPVLDEKELVYAKTFDKKPFELSLEEYLTRREFTSILKTQAEITSLRERNADLNNLDKLNFRQRNELRSNNVLLNTYFNNLSKNEPITDDVRQTFENEYVIAVNRAIKQGLVSPERRKELALTNPLFKKSAENRNRVEKGQTIGLIKESNALDASLLAEIGVNIRRQDNQEISEGQKLTIKKSLAEIQSVFGNLKEVFEKGEVAIIHTNGKQSVATTKENELLLGITNKGIEYKTLGNNFGKWLDREAGSQLQKEKGFTERISLSEIETRAFENLTPSFIKDAWKLSNKQNVDGLTHLKDISINKPNDIFARLVEQYLSVKIDNPNLAVENDYSNNFGYWSAKDFEILIPELEAELNKRLELVEKSLNIENLKKFGSISTEYGSTDKENSYKPETFQAEFNEFFGKQLDQYKLESYRQKSIIDGLPPLDGLQITRDSLPIYVITPNQKGDWRLESVKENATGDRSYHLLIGGVERIKKVFDFCAEVENQNLKNIEETVVTIDKNAAFVSDLKERLGVGFSIEAGAETDELNADVYNADSLYTIYQIENGATLVSVYEYDPGNFDTPPDWNEKFSVNFASLDETITRIKSNTIFDEKEFKQKLIADFNGQYRNNVEILFNHELNPDREIAKTAFEVEMEMLINSKKAKDFRYQFINLDDINQIFLELETASIRNDEIATYQPDREYLDLYTSLDEIKQISLPNNVVPTIGFTNEYYTLWYVVEMPEGERFTEYVQNLSHDLETAKAKVAEKFENYEIDLNLRGIESDETSSGEESGIYSKYADYEFHFGKLSGQDIRESADVWQINRARQFEFHEITREVAHNRMIEMGELHQVREEWLTSDEIILKAEKAFDVNGWHLENGERSTLELTVKHTSWFETTYGASAIQILRDTDNRIYKYLGSSPIQADKNEIVKVKGTIDHSTYNEVKETRLKRLSVIPTEERRFEDKKLSLEEALKRLNEVSENKFAPNQLIQTPLQITKIESLTDTIKELGFKKRDFVEQNGLSEQILYNLEFRVLEFETIPEEFISKIANAVNIEESVLTDYLKLPNINLIGDKITFAKAIAEDEGLTAEQKQNLLNKQEIANKVEPILQNVEFDYPVDFHNSYSEDNGYSKQTLSGEITSITVRGSANHNYGGIIPNLPPSNKSFYTINVQTKEFPEFSHRLIFSSSQINAVELLKNQTLTVGKPIIFTAYINKEVEASYLEKRKGTLPTNVLSISYPEKPIEIENKVAANDPETVIVEKENNALSNSINGEEIKAILFDDLLYTERQRTGFFASYLNSKIDEKFTSSNLTTIPLYDATFANELLEKGVTDLALRIERPMGGTNIIVLLHPDNSISVVDEKLYSAEELSNLADKTELSYLDENSWNEFKDLEQAVEFIANSEAESVLLTFDNDFDRGKDFIDTFNQVSNDKQKIQFGSKILPDNVLNQMPVRQTRETSNDYQVHAKLFHPMSSWTMFVTEAEAIRDADNKVVDVNLFGFVHTDGINDEWGYSSLQELDKTVARGLKTERDLNFNPERFEDVWKQFQKERGLTIEADEEVPTTTAIENQPDTTIAENFQIEFQEFITRQDLRDNPNKIYLFGDNLDEEGFGGQAREMRGEPNALGIPTKKTPGRYEKAYFTDDELSENMAAIDKAFAKIESLQSGTTIVIPSAGLGTGLAELEIRAPQTNAYLQEKLVNLEFDEQIPVNPEVIDKGLMLESVEITFTESPEFENSKYFLSAEEFDEFLAETPKPENPELYYKTDFTAYFSDGSKFDGKVDLEQEVKVTLQSVIVEDLESAKTILREFPIDLNEKNALQERISQNEKLLSALPANKSLKENTILPANIENIDLEVSIRQTLNQYRIPNYDIHDTGLKTKFKDNVEAIKLLRIIETEDRLASPEEQEILAKFSGWGGLKNAFDVYQPKPEWKNEIKELQILFTDSTEYFEARQSTENAHYTSPEFSEQMWQVAKKLGFDGGRVLEPAVGSGNFIGMMPDDLRGTSKVIAVEKESYSARIAKQLYQRSDIINAGFEETNLKNNSFDMVISNFPFGSFSVHDPEYNHLKPSIHDYFFLKSLDKVKEGGLVVALTSRYTMDKADSEVREAIARRADLVGAFRLPDTAFKNNAHTSVVTDLLIFQKHPKNKEISKEEIKNLNWMQADYLTLDDGTQQKVNNYFEVNPDHILGKTSSEGRMYGKEDLTVKVETQDEFRELVNGVINKLKPVFDNNHKVNLDEPVTGLSFEDRHDKKTGSLVLSNDKIFQITKAGDIELKLTRKEFEKTTALIGIRDSVKSIYSTELNNQSAEAQREELNQKYDKFVQSFGIINRPDNLKLLKGDPELYLVKTLETNVKEKTGKAEKAEIFYLSTIRGYERPTTADDLTQALAISLNETGKVKVERISELLSIDAETVIGEFSANNQAFLDPKTQEWEISEKYLSGNVRQKLTEVQELASISPENEELYKLNIEELTKVQPKDLDYMEIEPVIGATWIPKSDVKDFILHLTKADRSAVRAEYSMAGGQWSVSWAGNAESKRAKEKDTVTKIWGTSRADTMKIVQAALDGRPLHITDKVDNGDKQQTVTNVVETELANQKLMEIKQEFKDWIWSDPDRRTRLHREYNDKFNNIVERKYDGAHLTLPNSNPNIELRGHQKDGVWRAMQEPTVYMGHEVGTGKTIVIGAAMIEKKRIGQLRKPVLGCLKANIKQVTREIQNLYPTAKIFSGDGSFEAESRKTDIANIANNNYDLVILTYNQLDAIPLSKATQKSYIKSELRDLEENLAFAFEAEGKKSRLVTKLNKRSAALETQLEKILAQPKDDTVTFEETGIDYIAIDEAHSFKALPVYTTMQGIKGVPTSRSDRATNMHMRTEYLREKYGEGRLLMASGTPITNTVAELYNVMKFTMPETLAERGIHNFDAFAKNYTEVVTKIEATVTGEYKEQSRLAKFINTPELRSLAGITLDVVKADEAGVVRPARQDIVISVPISEEQVEYREELKRRAHNMKNVDPWVDNHLKLMNDGRQMSLDMRLIDESAEDNPQSKVNYMVANVLRIANEKQGATQLIFSNLGIHENEKTGHSVFNDVVDKLVEGGIPKERIANFAKLSPKKRKDAIEKLNSGEILVALGSTDTLGTGVNAQKFIAAAHNLDVPWLPSAVEQRDGRSVRNGNIFADLNENIELYRYVTVGTFDELGWTTIDRKMNFINQIVTNKLDGQRTFEEPDAEEFSAAQISAIASGNPDVMKRIELQESVQRFRSMEKRHKQTTLELADEIPKKESFIETRKEYTNALQTDYELYKTNRDKAGDKFKITLNGQEIDRIDETSAIFSKEMMTCNGRKEIGEFYGFKVVVSQRVGTGWSMRYPTISLESPLTNKGYDFKSAEPAEIAENLSSELSYLKRLAESNRRNYSKDEQELDAIKEQVNRPFRFKDELSISETELKEVEARLKDWQADKAKEQELNSEVKVSILQDDTDNKVEIIKSELDNIIEDRPTFVITPFISKDHTEAMLRGVDVAVIQERNANGRSDEIVYEEEDLDEILQAGLFDENDAHQNNLVSEILEENSNQVISDNLQNDLFAEIPATLNLDEIEAKIENDVIGVSEENFASVSSDESFEDINKEENMDKSLNKDSREFNLKTVNGEEISLSSRKPLTENELEVEAKTFEYLQENTEELVEAYYEMHGKQIINADRAKELFESYNENRLENDRAVQISASSLTQLILKRRLDDLPEGSEIILTAGGQSSGKSSVIAENKDADLIYDSVMGNQEGNRQVLDLITEKGHDASIVYVYRPIEEAAVAMMKRQTVEGRAVSEESIANGHFGSQQAFINDTDEYAKKLGHKVYYFETVENENPKEISLNELKEKAYNSKEETLQRAKAAIDQEYERREYTVNLRTSIGGNSEFRVKSSKIKTEEPEGNGGMGSQSSFVNSKIQTESTGRTTTQKDTVGESESINLTNKDLAIIKAQAIVASAELEELKLDAKLYNSRDAVNDRFEVVLDQDSNHKPIDRLQFLQIKSTGKSLANKESHLEPEKWSLNDIQASRQILQETHQFIEDEQKEQQKEKWQNHQTLKDLFDSHFSPGKMVENHLQTLTPEGMLNHFKNALNPINSIKNHPIFQIVKAVKNLNSAEEQIETFEKAKQEISEKLELLDKSISKNVVEQIDVKKDELQENILKKQIETARLDNNLPLDSKAIKAEFTAEELDKVGSIALKTGNVELMDQYQKGVLNKVENLESAKFRFQAEFQNSEIDKFAARQMLELEATEVTESQSAKMIAKYGIEPKNTLDLYHKLAEQKGAEEVEKLLNYHSEFGNNEFSGMETFDKSEALAHLEGQKLIADQRLTELSADYETRFELKGIKTEPKLINGEKITDIETENLISPFKSVESIPVWSDETDPVLQTQANSLVDTVQVQAAQLIDNARKMTEYLKDLAENMRLDLIKNGLNVNVMPTVSNLESNLVNFDELANKVEFFDQVQNNYSIENTEDELHHLKIEEEAGQVATEELEQDAADIALAETVEAAEVVETAEVLPFFAL